MRFSRLPSKSVAAGVKRVSQKTNLWLALFLVLAAATFSLAAPNALSISRADGIAGTEVVLDILLDTDDQIPPLAVQWSLTYSDVAFTLVTVSPGPAAVSADKTLECAGQSGRLHCLLTGMNETALTRGVLAQVTLVVSDDVADSFSLLTFTEALGVSAQLEGISVAAGSGGIGVPPGYSGPELFAVRSAADPAKFALAPSSWATLFGRNLARETTLASDIPLPTSLGAAEVLVTDSAGFQQPSSLSFAAHGQINFLVPADVAAGPARITVSREDQTGTATAALDFWPVAPALFTANANGVGVAAGVAVRVLPNGLQQAQLTFDGGSPEGSRAPLPIDLGSERDQVYLLLFGTGMRHSQGASATLDGFSVPVAGPFAHPAFLGLDQLNLGPLPRSLRGLGEVEINVMVDGFRANAVTVDFQ